MTTLPATAESSPALTELLATLEGVIKRLDEHMEAAGQHYEHQLADWESEDALDVEELKGLLIDSLGHGVETTALAREALTAATRYAEAAARAEQDAYEALMILLPTVSGKTLPRA